MPAVDLSTYDRLDSLVPALVAPGDSVMVEYALALGQDPSGIDAILQRVKVSVGGEQQACRLEASTLSRLRYASVYWAS